MSSAHFHLVAGPNPTDGLVASEGVVQTRTENGYADTYVYSRDGSYRYRFDRRWDEGPSLTWLGLNPGTGDSDGTARPTLRRMLKVSREHGYGALIVVNLFAWRAPKPAALLEVADPVGEYNNAVIATMTTTRVTDRTVACWGAHPSARARAALVCERLVFTPMVCLGLTAGREPRHPLYVRAPTLAAYQRASGPLSGSRR